MKTPILSVAAALVIAGCAGNPPPAATPPVDSGPAPKWAQETGKPQVPPPVVSYAAPDPGAAKPLPRAYAGAPPQIPHATADMAITAKENACLGCHTTEAAGEAAGKVAAGEAPPVPVSHFVDAYREAYNRDARNGLQTIRTATLPDAHGLLGSRYLCSQCHVPQAQVEPWVKSNF